MSAPIPNLMTVEQLAEHYGKAKKTIQNKLTRGWGPTPVTDPDTMQVLGFEVERWPVLTASTSRRASSASTPDVPNDMWLAVTDRLLTNLDILTAYPTRQSLASLIGLSIHEAGLTLTPETPLWARQR